MPLPVLFWLLTPGLVPAQDWPQFLGPTRDGVYTGPGKTVSSQLWKKAIGQGFASPVVAQGKLIVFFRSGEKEMVEAWNPADGKRIWSFEYPTSYRDDFGFDEGPRAAPTVEGNRVYTFGAEGVLHAFDLQTGKKIWRVDTHQKFSVRKGFFGAAGAPLVEGEVILLNVGGSDHNGIVGIDKNTGNVKWQATDHPAGYSSGVAATIDGTRHALFLTRTGLVDLEPAGGKVRFEFPWRSRSQASVNAATPLVAGNLVFVSASYGTGAAVLQITGDSHKKLWSNDDSLSNHYATSVVRDGVLYGFHGRQEEGPSLRAVDLKTGKVFWNVDGQGAGTITLGKEHLLVMTERGELITAPISQKAFQPVAKTKILDPTVRAYPAFAGGRMYVRNENTIACFVLQ